MTVLYEKELFNVADVMTMQTHKIDSRYCSGSGLSKKQVNIGSGPHPHLLGLHMAFVCYATPNRPIWGIVQTFTKIMVGYMGGRNG
ncbi:hypothetical protein JCM12294_39850 [Desulfocicer niacini]